MGAGSLWPRNWNLFFLRMEPGTGLVDPLCVELDWNCSSTGTIQEPPNTDKILHKRKYYAT